MLRAGGHKHGLLIYRHYRASMRQSDDSSFELETDLADERAPLCTANV
jgi:hypothetical protein